MADAAPLTLPAHNIIVVGSFNPSIIRSDWVRRHVFSPAAEIGTLLPVADGPIIYQHNGLTWYATRERLAAHSEDPKRTGDFIAAVVKKLPQTPLTAAGVNFTFSVKVRDFKRVGPWTVGVDANRASSLLGGSLKGRRLIQTVLRPDGVQLGLTLTWEPEPEEVVLSFNFQLEPKGQDEIERANQLAEHAARATMFADEARRIQEELADEHRDERRLTH